MVKTTWKPVTKIFVYRHLNHIKESISLLHFIIFIFYFLLHNFFQIYWNFNIFHTFYFYFEYYLFHINHIWKCHGQSTNVKKFQKISTDFWLNIGMWNFLLPIRVLDSRLSKLSIVIFVSNGLSFLSYLI